MGRLLTLEDLQREFDLARERLSRERADILSLTPLPMDFNRDSYSFSYIRAERMGLDVILRSLEQISWLPMQIDPHSEILLESKNAMKKWLNAPTPGQPDSTNFGNDFIHTLTRIAVVHGWQSPEFRWASQRIGRVFHDLSCLIGLIYYGVWMAENGIAGVPVSDPYDLERTAKEISYIMQSPEVAQFLNERKKQAQTTKQQEKKKEKPAFRVIHNEEWAEKDRPPSA